MKAIGYRRHGDVNVLEQLDVKKPTPRKGEVLVRVRAFGLNPLDYRLRRGEMRFVTWLKLPRYTASDFAGTIDALGEGVRGFSLNDRVFGMASQLLNGCSAQFIRVPEAQLTLIPASLSFEKAAAVPLASLTAYQALTELTTINSGTRILINGASGGVGTFATQFALLRGAVVTTVTSYRNIEMMSDLGAHHTIDYTQRDFVDGDERFDVIFDCYGNRTFEAVHPALTPNGLYISTIPAFSRYRSVIFNPLRTRKSSVVVVRARGHQLAEIADLIEAGDLRPIVERVYEPEAFREAYIHLESKRTRGKLAVKMV